MLENNQTALQKNKSLTRLSSIQVMETSLPVFAEKTVKDVKKDNNTKNLTPEQIADYCSEYNLSK